MMMKIREYLFFLILLITSVAFTLKIHQGRTNFNWRSEVWADKAGYYIYLPATFLYHFDVEKCPAGIEEKTGYSFTVDHQKKTITTQYFYGVALLVSPFFLAAHAVATLAGIDEQQGFSTLFSRFMDVAAAFYLVLGLFFLKRFLRNYFREALQYFIILVVFLGTNLFYFSMEDGLMSHVYSFFAISLFLFAMKEFLADNSRYRYFLLMAVSLGLMFVIRPTNCVVGFFFLFWDAESGKEILRRLKMVLHPGKLLPLLGIMFLFMIPQMIFWKLGHGTYIYLKYGETFTHTTDPKFAEVWFSTLNGLVPWSPVNLFIMLAMIFMVIRGDKNSIGVLVLFLGISYMAASYKIWYMGCGFGNRLFVEFYPLFCVPFGFLSEKIFNLRWKAFGILYSLIILLMIYMNVGMSLSPEKYFFGSVWDWSHYRQFLKPIHLYPKDEKQYFFRNDFENAALQGGSVVTDTLKRSGDYSAVVNNYQPTCCEHDSYVWDFGGKFMKFMTVQCYVMKPKDVPLHGFLVCSFEKNDSVINRQTLRLDHFALKPDQWFMVYKTFRIPEGLSGDTRMRFYVLGMDNMSFYLDDLLIRYE